ncbi:MAG: DUF1992 domain-containing protein [Chloroflexi bacterium]|nr:MAG: DUF1992 domain-containing protein [Chloroflexota bacterium]
MDIEDQIRKAIEEGKFNDLAGKGKPLNLDENPFEDPSWRTAYKMLKDNGFSLPWIETRREIDEAIRSSRSQYQRAKQVYAEKLQAKKTSAQAAAELRQAQQRFRDAIAEINKQIFAYNLQTPSPKFQMLPLTLEKEL